MRLSILALCAALTIPVAAARSAPPPSTSASAPAVHMRGGLTPEERMLYMKQVRGRDWRKLPVAQRCERMQQVRRERRQMTPAAFQQLKQKLDAEWNALPPAQRKRIEQRIANHQARRQEGSPRQHQRRCAGVEDHSL